MSFTVQTQTGTGSTIRSPGRLEDARRNWNALAGTAHALRGVAAGLQRAADLQPARTRLSQSPLGHLHPFKIYRLPSVLRVTPAPATDWRKFRVRAGLVCLTAAAGLAVAGTDDADFPGLEMLDEDDVADIVVPDATASYKFWVEIDDEGDCHLRHAADPTVEHETYNPNPWTAYPAVDQLHFLIGWVDTLTHTATRRALVRQLIRADITAAGGGTGVGNFRGEYYDAGAYTAGDFVVVLSGANTGTYVCVQDDPGSENPPWLGGGWWVKLPTVNALGQWM
jgi:hypothetical protein